MILNKEEAKKILSKIKEYSKADSFDASLNGFNISNLRYALNSVSTNGFSDGLQLGITSSFGKRSGSVIINNVSDSEIKKAVEKSESIAKLLPENDEFVPPLDPQTYSESNNFSETTKNLNFEQRASFLIPFIEKSINSETESAGFWEDEVSFYSIINSNDLFAYNLGTLASFSATVRVKEGNGSSRVQNQFVDVSKFDFDKLSNKVINRSILSIKPKEIKPGKYTVILEPSASADMVHFLTHFMDARSADEGRSYFSKKGNGNKIGEKIVNDKVNIYSDPTDRNCPGINFALDGTPREKTIWFENGVLKNLIRSRFWAEKSKQPVVPGFSNLIMSGTNKSTEELIANTDYGILVTRFWYIRTVDPQTTLLTGLTRDGLFEIRNGKISNPIKNFRFNESPVNMLNNIIDIGKSENAIGSETDRMQIFAPALKVKEFNFSSLSDAV